MPFTPGDPWPDTTYPGGAAHLGWGGYTRLVVQAQIAAGHPFRVGPDPNDRLNAGNVMSQAGGLPAAAEAGDPRAAPSGLWVDLSCDITDLEVTLGASTSTAGILTKAEAGTLTATLWDPTGKYDPLNPTGVYSLGGVTRLVPGSPIRAFVEVITNPRVPSPTVARYPLFTGTADRWEQAWVQWEGDRFAKLVASDETKRWTKFDKPEQPPTGQGDDAVQRMGRLITLYEWIGGLQQRGTSLARLQSSTMAQSGWELANRTMDDELGFVYFPPQLPTASWNVIMMLICRSIWTARPPTMMNIGCAPAGDPDTWYDIAVDAQPMAFDALLLNTAYAGRTGGTMQTVANASSVARFGLQSIQRTDLGFDSDPGSAAWGQLLVNLNAFPHTALDHLTLNPAVVPETFTMGPWRAFINAFQVELLTAGVRVLWEGFDYTADVLCRVAGQKHNVTTDAWEITWYTLPASAVASFQSFHLGPHAQDKLDAGFVLGG